MLEVLSRGTRTLYTIEGTMETAMYYIILEKNLVQFTKKEKKRNVTYGSKNES